MEANAGEYTKKYLHLKRFPRISLHCKLQYSSKILKHLCLFPLPQCWFGYHSGLSAAKHPWLNIGEVEGTFQGGKQCEVKISGFLQKIREKRCLFQRFVTSIVVPVQYWEYEYGLFG